MDELEFRRQSMLMDANYNQQVDLLNRTKKAALEQINANNAWSAEQAQKQMEFQERMSNTSHQREMEDLKAAGLNPILSAQSGATSPSGAMAQADPNATSAIVSIMGKVLDIANDNAKAQMALASAANTSIEDKKVKTSSYGYSYSGKSIFDNDVKADGIQLIADLASGNAYSVKNAVGSFVKGFLGVKETYKDNKAAYMLGSLAEENRNPASSVSAMPNQKTVENNLKAAGAVTKVVNKVVNKVKSVVSNLNTNAVRSMLTLGK